MNLAYLHVVFNHLPIMGVPVGLLVLLLGLWARDDAIKRAALVVFAFIAVATIGVWLAGRGGEDYVEHVVGLSEEAIDAHKAMATLALGATVLLGAVSLFVLLANGGFAAMRRLDALAPRPLPAGGITAVLLLAVLAAGVLANTGRLGGKIRHTEFLHGAPHAAEAGDRGETGADHDDDGD